MNRGEVRIGRFECRTPNTLNLPRPKAIQRYTDRRQAWQHPIVRVVAWTVLVRALGVKPGRVLRLVLGLLVLVALSSCTVYVRPTEVEPPTVYVPTRPQVVYYDQRPPTYRCRWVFPQGVAELRCKGRQWQSR